MRAAPVVGPFDVTSAQLALFGALLTLGLLFAYAISPRRRRAVGGLRFMAGRALVLGAPLFGVVVVRGAVALGHVETGWSAVPAQLVGVFWGGVFAIAAQIGLRLWPPTAWLIREHRRAAREASFLRAAFRGAPTA